MSAATLPPAFIATTTTTVPALRWFSSAFADLLGSRCALCRARPAEDGLCAACRESAPVLPAEQCPVCAIPVPGGHVCGQCVRSPPAFDAVAAACRYEFPADELIRALKYRAVLAAARPLASLLAEHLVAEPEPDLVVPLPLSPARERERGFNQALVIARCLPGRWARHIAPGVLSRTADGPPQAGLPFEERARNVRGAFEATTGLQGARVAVVDDVLTTGATLGAAAEALKRAGAAEVRGWVVARTLAGR